MKILNGKEAFEAMMAGRKIMCRAVGELMDFDDLDRFPATIFAMPGYEFSIKVETMELAGITFAKPLTLEDVVEDQEIFLVYPNHIAHTQFTSLSGKYVECVKNGFAQMDQENAELQLQAIGKLLGRTIAYPLTIESHYKPEKKRRSRKAKEDTEQLNTPAGPDDAVPNIEKQPEPEVVQPVEAIEQQATINTEASVTKTEEDVLDETDPAVQKFIEAIDKCNSDYELQGVERNLDGNQHKLHETEYEELKQRIKDKRISFFPATDTVSEILNAPVEQEQSSGNLSVNELKRLQKEAENLITQGKALDEEYQNLLTDLLDRASKASTPTEANSLVRYTRAWTEEQRKPLLEVIHKRLVQLNDANEPPSLAVRIQRAEDLTELDALEIDISSCDPVIQPRLMELIEQRRIQLDHLLGTGEAS
ncbi:hypothetical protein [Acinetobacter schindleri]|uniref:hypothetical protein n=1 Tax=Acinetobacter schindleri TaxID=108981 RepID=UPI0028988CC2|nr:hypothetical protein [Acinetobacter schindleri]